MRLEAEQHRELAERQHSARCARSYADDLGMVHVHLCLEVAVALELGDPPGFNGVRCVDCGNRFRTEFDHVEPRAAQGPTAHPNLDPRCWSCHTAKTERDRRAGKLRPAEP